MILTIIKKDLSMTEENIKIDKIDVLRIKELIPHRYPMLFVDRMKDIVLGQSAVGIKAVTINEPFFQGHFPEHPVMPGVLIVEAMAQTAAALVMLTLGEETEGKIVYFMSIDGAKFRKPVLPGEILEFHIEKDRARGKIWSFIGKAKVEGKVVAEAKFKAMIAD
jgi:3-hydroxyacyl-[acyl-carrier-protein] dehydratase